MGPLGSEELHISGGGRTQTRGCLSQSSCLQSPEQLVFGHFQILFSSCVSLFPLSSHLERAFVHTRVHIHAHTHSPLHITPPWQGQGPLRQVSRLQVSGLVAEDGSFCPVCSLTRLTESWAWGEGGLLGGGDTTGDVHVKYSLAGWGGWRG